MSWGAAVRIRFGMFVRLVSVAIVLAVLAAGLSVGQVAAAPPRKYKAPPVQKTPLVPYTVASAVPTDELESPSVGPRRGTQMPNASAGKATIAAAPGRERVAGTPILVGQPGGGDPSAGLGVRASVRDQRTAKRLGVDGIVVSLEASEPVEERVPVAVDYSSFENAFGAGYGARLRLVQLPSCALTTPDREGCDTRTPLPSRNDTDKRLVSTSVDVADSAAPVVLAVEATASSSEGTFAATPLSPSGSWAASGASGNFTWSYPIQVPAAPGPDSATPSIALGYNSATADGRTVSTNNQSSWVGEGFDYTPGYIERTYRTCADDKTIEPEENQTDDLCWAGQVVTMNLGGKTTALVFDDKGDADPANDEWHPENDDGERVVVKKNPGNGAREGEYFEVTTQGGVVYHFGRGLLPGGTAAQETNSVWSVPVIGAHPGDPCHDTAGFRASRCSQAWRWNLDYVEDPHANAMAYFYATETNKYDSKPADNETDMVSYTRGGYLTKIEYGLRNENGSIFGSPASHRVMFDIDERCIPTTGENAFDCDPSKFKANPNRWPDTPSDLVCDGSETCHTYGPTFWSRKRVSSIRTQYRDGAGNYSNLDTYAFGQGFPFGAQDTMRLNSITRTGRAADGTTTQLPPVQFEMVDYENAVQTDGGPGSVPFPRLSKVIAETGQITTIDYNSDPGQENRAKPLCTKETVPTDLANNTTECYPVKVLSTEDGEPAATYFYHKYVVTEVTVTDPNKAQNKVPDRVTTYTYKNNPAWHYDDNEIVRAKARTHGQFRGYGLIETRTGNPDAAGAWTLWKSKYTRGMGWQVTNSLGETVDDSNALADKLVEQITYLGDTAKPVKTALTDHKIIKVTGSRDRGALPDLTSNIVRQSRVRQLTYNAAGAAPVSHNIISTFDDLGRETSQADTGTGVKARCTLTEYADNTTTWIRNRPSTVTTAANSCPEGGPTLVEVIGKNRFYYDHSDTLGYVGTRGLPVRTERATRKSADLFLHFTTETTSYDDHGRELSHTVYPVAGETGRLTKTAYEPSTGGPVTTITTTNPKNQTTTTYLDRARGLPVKQVDVADLVTEAKYDGLGRVVAVWQPGQDRGVDPATTTYQYKVEPSQNPAVAVTTSTLVDNGVAAPSYKTAVSIYDAFGGIRQTQAPAVGEPDKRIITDTYTDSHGWTIGTNHNYLTAGQATADELVLGNPSGLSGRTAYAYDGAGRGTERTDYQGLDLASATRKITTKTYHDGLDVTVVPPTGGVWTTTSSDVRGQTVSLKRWSTHPTISNGAVTAGTGAARTTTYVYDEVGNQTTITSPAGTTLSKTWTTDYDLAGNPTKKVDPDAGTSTMTYNDVGELVTASDADNTLTYTYDALGRKVQQNNGTTKLASWTYDSLQAGKVTESTRWTGGKPYTVTTTGYDPKTGDPLGSTVTLPNETGFRTSYTTAQTWTSTHLPRTQTLAPTTATAPTTGGYAAEQLVHDYDQLGMPTVTRGMNTYVSETIYTPFGEVARLTLGANDATGWINQDRDPLTRNITTSLFSGTTGNQQLEKVVNVYNDAGNITKIADVQGDVGAPTQRHCYLYNNLGELTTAWSSKPTTCTKPTTATVSTTVGGPAAQQYWKSWTIDAAGNRDKEVRNKVPGISTPTTTLTYAQGVTGHAHAVASTTTAVTGGSSTTETYGYDNRGNMTKRGSQTIAYDPFNRVSSIKSGTTTQAAYVYDADGNQMLRRDQSSTTLYLPGQEITYTPSSSSISVNRYYTHAGRTVAMRTGLAKVNYLFADQHGTHQVAVNPANWVVTRRYLDPYGNPLGTATGWVDPNHGFLGKPQSATTGLTDIGARKYDPKLGRFISVDPLLTPGDPTQLNGYQYGGNNPVNRADPTGLILLDSPGGGSPSEPSPIPAAPEPYEPPAVSEDQPWYEDAWDAGTDYVGDVRDGTVDTFTSVDGARDFVAGVGDLANDTQDLMYGGPFLDISKYNGGEAIADWIAANDESDARKAGTFWGTVGSLFAGGGAGAATKASSRSAEALRAARAARDAKAAEVGRRKATVTAGYGRDGRPVAGCNSNPIGCAEDDVARQIGGDPNAITFTEAIRPRTGEQVPICARCQGTYDRSQFPPGTFFDPLGPWGTR
jgi:RHS repeat-associated protein